MNRRFKFKPLRTLPLLLLAGVLFGLLAQPAQAQDLREGGHWYLKPRVGLTFYAGDRDGNEDNDLSQFFDDAGFGFGLEVGYHFTPAFALGLYHLSGRYPAIDNLDPALEPLDDTSEWRHIIGPAATFYLLPRARLTPYFLVGAGVVFGKVNGEYDVGFGPLAGLGLDLALSPRVGLFVEGTTFFSFPDTAVDGSDSPASGDDDSNADVLGFLGGGLRINFGSKPVPPVLGLSCPSGCFNPGDEVSFTSTMNEDATEPVEYRWRFGDGTEATGTAVTHRFDRPGEYTVILTASNKAGTVERSCPIIVGDVEINRLTATPQVVNVCDGGVPIRFAADVTSLPASLPATYLWDFGDGTSFEGLTPPPHVYQSREARTYTVSLRASNSCDSDVRTIPITAVCRMPPVIALTPVFFCDDKLKACPQGVYATRLSDDAQRTLVENLRALSAYLEELERYAEEETPSPELDKQCLLVEGYASRNERTRNPERLARQRAEAVRQYYVEQLSVAPERIRAVGRGLDENAEVRTTPVRCDELNN